MYNYLKCNNLFSYATTYFFSIFRFYYHLSKWETLIILLFVQSYNNNLIATHLTGNLNLVWKYYFMKIKPIRAIAGIIF
jgi:hypothetical protein